MLEKGRWRHYGREDGLIWDDTDGLAIHTDSEGRVWVGTSGGLSRYTPTPYPITRFSAACRVDIYRGSIARVSGRRSTGIAIFAALSFYSICCFELRIGDSRPVPLSPVRL